MTIADLRQPGLDPRDVDQILAFVAGRDVAYVLAHPESVLSAAQAAQAADLLARRAKHEPLAYLLGTQPFYGRTFRVSPDVLIPRPESELMIDELKKVRPASDRFTLIDVGTGSGVLAITAALEWPNAQVIATDISPAALVIARDNARQLGAERIEFIQGNVLNPLIEDGRQADVIFANLPYLPAEEIEQSPTSKELAHEPQLALLADDQGLALIKRCIAESLAVLNLGGQLYLEMLPWQLPVMAGWLMLTRLPYKAETIVDLSGQNRILRLTKVRLP